MSKVAFVEDSEILLERYKKHDGEAVVNMPLQWQSAETHKPAAHRLAPN
jgi:hypothetical protein